MAKKNLPSQSESAVVAVTTQDVEARMLQLRGQYVLLDRDVAAPSSARVSTLANKQ